MGSTLAAIRANPKLRLQIIATGMHLSVEHGKDGPHDSARGMEVGCDGAVEGGFGRSGAVATGKAIAGLAEKFSEAEDGDCSGCWGSGRSFCGGGGGHICGACGCRACAWGGSGRWGKWMIQFAACDHEIAHFIFRRRRRALHWSKIRGGWVADKSNGVRARRWTGLGRRRRSGRRCGGNFRN